MQVDTNRGFKSPELQRPTKVAMAATTKLQGKANTQESAQSFLYSFQQVYRFLSWTGEPLSSMLDHADTDPYISLL